MIKASDYLALFLSENKIEHVFGIQGGAVVHLFDSIEKQSKVRPIYCHHEQAAALAATAYSKINHKVGCVITTTGPATTNALTGLLAAWQDSNPVLFISGQTRIEHTSYNKKVRQVGSQEFNILDLVKPITKFSKLVENVTHLPSILAEAHKAATSGRQGPVWIDFPVNLQWQTFQVDKKNNSAFFKPKKNFKKIPQTRIKSYLKNAKRPLFIIGNGIRSSKSEKVWERIVKKYKLPFVTSWTGMDVLSTNNSSNLGIIGVVGHRGANKLLFESDLLICLGCRLGLTQTSTLTSDFAKSAKKIIVDIDKDQLQNLTVEFDLKIETDLNYFLETLPQFMPPDFSISQEWSNKCNKLKKLNKVEYTLAKENRGNNKEINSNYFNFKLTSATPKKSIIVVDGGGTALYTGFQASVLKANQRLICSSAISAMGTGIPEAIGASISSSKAETYCIIGDGSMMFNLQELQTVKHHNLPIKIIIYNNLGYLAIKHTQQSFLNKKFYGTDINNGLSMPDFRSVAKCFNIPFKRIRGLRNLDRNIIDIISHQGSLIVEVFVPQLQEMLFQQGFKAKKDGTFAPHDLSEMKPYL